MCCWHIFCGKPNFQSWHWFCCRTLLRTWAVHPADLQHGLCCEPGESHFKSWCSFLPQETTQDPGSVSSWIPAWVVFRSRGNWTTRRKHGPASEAPSIAPRKKYAVQAQPSLRYLKKMALLQIIFLSGNNFLKRQKIISMYCGISNHVLEICDNLWKSEEITKCQ